MAEEGAMEEEVCPVAGWEGTPVKVVQMGEVVRMGGAVQREGVGRIQSVALVGEAVGLKEEVVTALVGLAMAEVAGLARGSAAMMAAAKEVAEWVA